MLELQLRLILYLTPPHLIPQINGSVLHPGCCSIPRAVFLVHPKSEEWEKAGLGKWRMQRPARLPASFFLFYCPARIPSHRCLVTTTARQETYHRIKGEKRELSPNCPLQVMPGPLGCCFPLDWDPNPYLPGCCSLSPSVFPIH